MIAITLEKRSCLFLLAAVLIPRYVFRCVQAVFPIRLFLSSIADSLRKVLKKFHNFFICCFRNHATGQLGKVPGSEYERGSVFTVPRILLGGGMPYSNDESFDVAVIRLKDDGSFMKPDELKAAANVITNARQANVNGVVVVVFIHGWHHNAAWDTTTNSGDQHFSEFRRVLMTLTLREAERKNNDKQSITRRVIGVYIGWNGEPAKGLLRHIPLLKNLTFWNRLSTAEKISESMPIQEALREIVYRTKKTENPWNIHTQKSQTGRDSPLIFLGHSMGALILERAFLKVLQNSADDVLLEHDPGQARPVKVTRGDKPVVFPDLLLLVNSAAGSDTAIILIKKLEDLKIKKEVKSGSIKFSSPLVVSMTSPCDVVTRIIWRLGNWQLAIPPWRKTEGHDRSLFTHEFANDRQEVKCVAKRGKNLDDWSFGQAWHCLRFPEPENSNRPAFRIDLPKGFPLDEMNTSKRQHVRYVLRPLAQPGRSNVPESSGKDEYVCPFWIFQIPPDISASHSDLFNYRSSLLILALMQICGEVMSLANTWEEVFQEDEA
jgi:hypothetical protein